MARNWNGKLVIGTVETEVNVTLIDETEFNVGEWYGSGYVVSGSFGDIHNALIMGQIIETPIGNIIINDTTVRNGVQSFTFVGTGKSKL